MEKSESGLTQEKPRGVVPLQGYPNYYITKKGVIWVFRDEWLIVPYKYSTKTSGLTYKYVHLWNEHGRRVFRAVHHLVYLTFKGFKVKRIFFKDGNCFNCHIDNLTEECPPYTLEEGEEWVKGFEGLYFTYKGGVYSVNKREYPLKLKPAPGFKLGLYSLYDKEGRKYNFYY